MPKPFDKEDLSVGDTRQLIARVATEVPLNFRLLCVGVLIRTSINDFTLSGLYTNGDHTDLSGARITIPRSIPPVMTAADIQCEVVRCNAEDMLSGDIDVYTLLTSKVFKSCAFEEIDPELIEINPNMPE